MLIWILGPDSAQLEMKPYGCEANPQRIKVEPGCMVILRPDTVGHVLTCLGKCFALSCFYWEGGSQPSKRRMDDEHMTPAAKALEDWAEDRLRQIKELGPDAPQVDLPRRWELKMNHTGFTGQQVAVRGKAARVPSSWNPDEFFESIKTGVDLAVEVPLLRWDHGQIYSGEDYIQEDTSDQVNFRTNARHAMFIDGVDLFDNAKFRLSRSEAGGMDPGQRHLLEVGYESLVSCGITEAKMRNSRGAVLVAASNQIEWVHAERSASGGGVCGAGNNISAGRFSFVHGLKGPCVSFDQENAGSLVALQYGSTVISKLGTWEPAPWAVVYSYYLLLANFPWMHYTIMGVLSPKGRCFSFDASASGYARAECVASVCLKPMLEDVKGKAVLATDDHFEVAIAGTHVNQNGKRASITAPDGAAEQACAYESIRAADISPLDLDAMECNAVGSIIGDAIEAASMSRACRPEGMIGLEEACPLNMMSQKTSIGNAMDASGLTQLMKVASLASAGVMDPNVHTRLLNPHIDIEVCERPAFIATEALECMIPSCYIGIFGRNLTGTNVHAVLWGSQDEARRAASAKETPPPYEALSFWPAGGGDLASAPKRGYYIRGTWSGMELEVMESMGQGHFGFTCTLGEHRWEQFQILVDGDVAKVLHPGMVGAPKGSKVIGPEDEMYLSCWMISGLQGDGGQVEAAESGAVVGAEQEMATQIMEGPPMRTFFMGDEDEGVPGDQYSVSLLVSGQWTLVSWQKLASKGTPRDGRYHVGCFWPRTGGFSWHEMSQSSSGVFTADISITSRQGEFIIARDAHWNQLFVPFDGQFGKQAEGPLQLEEGSGRRWPLPGAVGSTARVTFAPEKAHGGMVDAELVESSAVVTLPPAVSQPQAEHNVAVVLAGPAGSFADTVAMRWSGSHYQLFIKATEEIRFHIMVDGRAFCPQRDGARLPDHSAAVTELGAPMSWLVNSDNTSVRWEVIVSVAPSTGASPSSPPSVERVDCLRVPPNIRLEDAYATGFYIIV